MIWKQEFTLEGINQMAKGTLSDFLGMTFSNFGPDYLEMTMEVKPQHKQPMGLLHGGVTAAMAETIGSVASVLAGEGPLPSAVGIELNINHLSSVQQGTVIARCSPIRIGRTIHVWDIRIRNDVGKNISAARLTTMIKSLDPNK